MNKKLLALAVGAALAATAGVASADISWYGKANLAVESGDHTKDGDEDTYDLTSGGSRIGINASEDIGNGLEVRYWHEWSFDVSDGTNPGLGEDHRNSFGHRDNLLSFHGSFGMFGGGALAAPSKVIGAGKMDLFADTVGDVNAAPFGGIIRQPAGSQLRYGNKIGDVSFTLAYLLENGADEADSFDGNVLFNVGPVELGLGYNSASDNAAPGGAAFDNLLNAVAIYKMDNIKLMAGYQTISAVGHDDEVDETAFTIGGVFGFGDNAILAQYTSGDADNDSEGDLTAIGFEHSLSKNLGVGVHYASFSPQDDDEDDVSGWDIGASFKF